MKGYSKVSLIGPISKIGVVKKTRILFSNVRFSIHEHEIFLINKKETFEYIRDAVKKERRKNVRMLYYYAGWLGSCGPFSIFLLLLYMIYML